jgi:hypothetical protein
VDGSLLAHSPGNPGEPCEEMGMGDEVMEGRRLFAAEPELLLRLRPAEQAADVVVETASVAIGVELPAGMTWRRPASLAVGVGPMRQRKGVDIPASGRASTARPAAAWRTVVGVTVKARGGRW